MYVQILSGIFSALISLHVSVFDGRLRVLNLGLQAAAQASKRYDAAVRIQAFVRRLQTQQDVKTYRIRKGLVRTIRNIAVSGAVVLSCIALTLNNTLTDSAYPACCTYVVMSAKMESCATGAVT